MSRPTPKMVDARRQRVVDLVRSGSITSQAQLQEILASEGFGATQGTLSRDLEVVGAVKVRSGRNGTPDAYFIPEVALVSQRPAADDRRVRRLMVDWVVDVVDARSLVVVRTVPGAAHLIADVLRGAAVPGVVALVPGSDAVLVAVSCEPSVVVEFLSSLMASRPEVEPPVMAPSPGVSPFAPWEQVSCPWCDHHPLASELNAHVVQAHPEQAEGAGDVDRLHPWIRGVPGVESPPKGTRRGARGGGGG